MKWFKHISDSLDDPDISDSVDIFGSDGYLVFFRVLELMSREFNVDNPGISTFSVDFLKKKIPISRKKILKILHFFNKRQRIFVSFHNGEQQNMVTLNCPKLKKLTDEFTRKLLPGKVRSKSGVTPVQEVRSKKKEQDNKEQPVYIKQETGDNKDNKTVKDTQVNTDNIEQIICYLNKKLKTDYKTGTGKTRELIKARLKEDFTVEDFKIVIDKKYLEWGDDPKMSIYLRPVTLFSNRFEGYLNQINAPEKSDLQRKIESSMRKYGGIKDD